MNRQTHNLPQSSPDWHAFRAKHFGASELSAAMGQSKYTTRTDLLQEKATGISKEIDARTQALFDKGHAAEAAARAIAESIIGEELSPMVMSLEVDELPISASLDGITFDGEIIFEHKLWSEKLAAQVLDDNLEEHYKRQMDQQLMVSGAKKCLFMTSDGTSDNISYCWYESNLKRENEIIGAWKQFAADLANYQPVEIIEKPKADVIIELPALFVHAKGEITTHNMKEFGEALQAKLEEVRAIALVTDQDFSNAKAAAKMFRDKAKEIKVSKDSMLSQTVTIGEAARMMDAWSKDLNETALQLEKDVEKEDLAKKRLMVSEAGLAYSVHIEALEAETRPIQLNVQRPDFATAIKGKRNYASMQGAVDDALANGKIAADAAAKDIRAKLTWCKETSAGFGFLFNDLAQIISKPMDDFQLVVTSRIDAHKAAEAAKLEAEREVMRIEEEAKAKAKIEAEAAARAKSEAEVIAKADEEERAKAAIEAAAKLKAEQDVKPEPTTRPVTTWPFPTPATSQEQSDVVESAPTLGDVLHAVVPVSIAQAIAPRRPNRAELLNAVAATFGVTNEDALDWILQEFRADIKFAAKAAA